MGPMGPKRVQKLARKYSVLSAKWMLFVTSEKVDKVWGMIARAVIEKQLGPLVTGVVVYRSAHPNSRTYR